MGTNSMAGTAMVVTALQYQHSNNTIARTAWQVQHGPHSVQLAAWQSQHGRYSMAWQYQHGSRTMAVSTVHIWAGYASCVVAFLCVCIMTAWPSGLRR